MTKMMIEQDKCHNNSFQQCVTQKSTGVTNGSSFAIRKCQRFVSSFLAILVQRTIVEGPRPVHAVWVQWNRQDGM